MPLVTLSGNAPTAVSNAYTNMSASALVKTGDGYLAGIIMASGSGTIKLWDSTTAAGSILVNTFTPILGWNPLPVHFTAGLFVTITGSMDITVTYI